MKKITLLFTFLIAFGYSGYAQVSAYSFTTNTTGVLDPMTGSTQLIGTGSDDGASAVTPIGFAFTYAGTVYNNFSANSNGLARLGTTAVTTAWTNSAANANTATPAIFPYWDDLATGSAAGGGKVHYLLTGTAPNQKLIIEWFVTVPRATAGAANARFQCVLEETTNIVSFVYGAGMLANTANSGASIGLATATTVYNTVTASTNTNTTSTFVTNNTGAITSGTSYVFTPPNPCTGTPVAGTVAPAMQTLLVGQASAALVATGFTSGVSGLTFQWQESADGSTGWVNAVGGTGATTASYTPPVFASTIYYRLVVTCTNGGAFANTTSVVLTGCSTVTAFTQNFDGVTTPAFPGCWAKVGALGSAYTQTGSPNSTPNTLYMYGTSGTAQPVVVMQPVSNLGAGTHRLRFNMRANVTANGVIEFGYLTNQTDATTFVSLGTATAAALTYAEYIISPAAGTYSNFPAFRHSGVPANSLLIDDVKWEPIPACLAPTTLSVANITTTSANLSWVDPSGSQFDYEYKVQAQGTGMPAAAPGTGTGLDISSFPLPVTAGSLTVNTPYEFWVRANCGASGFSTWSGPFNFTTTCNPYTVPYFEGFESGYTQDVSISGCLIQESVVATQVWTANTSLTDYNRTPRTGSWNSYLRYGNEDWIFIPITLVGGTSYTVDLYARQDGTTTTNSNMSISYGSSGNVAGMTNVIVPATGISNAYQRIVGNFTPATSGTYYVGIKGYMNSSPWYISLDDISIIETPACQAPIGLAVSNLTDTAADISWTATTGSYEYVLDMVATDPAGAGAALAAATYNASGLTPLTTYYFHVRTVCTGPAYSTWSTISFITPATPPANDNCSAAQVLTPGGVFATNEVVGTNVGATNSGETAPGCASFLGGDVWYQVTVPASGNITIETNNNGGTMTDTGMAVYSGSCGSLVLVECDDDDSLDGAFSLVVLTGRAPGEVLYVSVWEYGNNTFDTFKVSAYDASLSSNSFDSNAFLAYPNPVKDVLNLEYNSEISSVRVMNLLGQEVISRNINANATQVDMSQLSAGAYIVNVIVGDAVKTIKVVKQ